MIADIEGLKLFSNASQAEEYIQACKIGQGEKFESQNKVVKLKGTELVPNVYDDVSIDSDTKPTVIHFQERTPQENRDIVEGSAGTKELPELEFDNFSLRDKGNLKEFMLGVAELLPHEYGEAVEDWIDATNDTDSWMEDILENVVEDSDPTSMVLAGLTSIEDFEETGRTVTKISPKVGKFILMEVMGSNKFPRSLKLSFNREKLCINGCPTVVLQRDLMNLYNSLLALRSPEEAMRVVTEIIEEKLEPLFKREAS